MKNNIQIDKYAEGYQNGLFEAESQYEKELAALRAENAKLREGLKAVMEEMDRIWDEFEIGDELPRSLGRHILNSTTPDPLYASAPEMLEALERCNPYMNDLEGENFEDSEAGIFHDKDLSLAVETLRFAIKKAKGEPYP